MRKIEQQMIDAIENKKQFNSGNTRVEYLPEVDTSMQSRIEHCKIYLHGNHIATYAYGRDRYYMNKNTLLQWPTNTTKSRLNALGFKVAFKQGKILIDGVKI